MADDKRHGKQLADYLGKHRRQQREGYGSPNKSAGNRRQIPGMPSIDKLNIRDVSPSQPPLRESPSVLTPTHQSRSASAAKTKGATRASKTGARTVQPVRTFKRKATINDLPTELLLHIFSFLPPDYLLTCACVNRQWLALASDNVLWQPLYERYASQSSSGKSSSASSKTNSTSRPHPVYSLHADVRWKKACIKECVDKRNSRIATLLRKKHPYSLLPANTEKTIQKLGLQWQLVFTDSDKVEHSFTHSDAFHFHTSSTVRWYSLNPPPIRSLRCLAVYALAPIFFSKDGSAANNSPCQKALLLEHRIKPSDLTGVPVIQSDVINVYTSYGGIVIATWKDGGEIAFVSLCLHHHGIIQRATLGTSERMSFPVPVKPRPDDIDSEYGLHDYTCIMELRHQRTTLWSQQFLRLHSNKYDKVEGFVRLTPIRGDVVTDHSYSSKRIQFPWKTDVFKGIIKDFAVLDCTVYDEFQQPVWCISSPVSISEDDQALVTMEYEGDPCVIQYSDHKGNVEIRMFWIPDREQHIMVAANIDLAVKTVNDWFGTHY